MNFSVTSCCTFCPPASCAFATLAYSPIVTGPSCWLCVVLICKPVHPHRQLTGLVAYAGRLGRAVFDPPGRFPFHQVGHPRLPRYLWLLEQVFQPPRFAFGIASLGLDNNCFTNFALSGDPCRKGF